MYLTNFERDELGFVGKPVVDAMEVAIACQGSVPGKDFYLPDMPGFLARMYGESPEAFAVMTDVKPPAATEESPAVTEEPLAVAPGKMVAFLATPHQENSLFSDTWSDPVVDSTLFTKANLTGKSKTDLAELAQSFYGIKFQQHLTRSQMVNALLELASK